MERRVCGWICTVALVAVSLGWPVSKVYAQAGAAQKSKYALLIGISSYQKSHLDSLDGPANDIRLVAGVLKSTFDVPAANTTVILDDAATHTHIRDAFADLAKKVAPGDFVYIQFSGHGSTAADALDRRGEDQTWVAFGSRSGARGIDDYDVLDKEIATWMQPIYAKTNEVVFVSDSCHSATASRGERRGNRAARRDARPHPLLQTVTRLPPPTTGIRIGAARDQESALEIDPVTGEGCTDAKHCQGVFTWFWVQQLRRARPEETWQEVFDRTMALVTSAQGISQRPQIEGTSNRRVFGGAFEAPVNTLAILEVNAKEIKLQGGAAALVTQGSVYKLHGGKGVQKGEEPELKITAVGATTSTAAVVRGKFAPNDLVVESVHAYSFPRIKLYVGGDFEKDADAALVNDLRESLGGLTGFVQVTQRSAADWWVYVVHTVQSVDDAPTDPELPVSVKGTAPVAWVVSPDGMLAHPSLRFALTDVKQGKQNLAQSLRKFAWSREVKHLGARGKQLPVSLTVDVMHANESSGGSYGLASLPRKLGFNDSLGFTVKNEDPKRSLYAYVVAISPDATVQVIHPFKTDNEDEARLTPGELFSIKERYRLDAFGIESLMVISTEEPIKPLALSQPGYSSKGATATSQLGVLLSAKSHTRGSVESPVQVWSAVGVDVEIKEPHYPAGVFLEPHERVAPPAGVEIRRVAEKGLVMTREEEGFRALPYNDIARYCTIAYGHLIKKAECNGTEPAEFLTGVSQKRGGEILDMDMLTSRWSVQQLTRAKLSDNQFAALADFVFNVGTGNFSHSTLLEVLNSGSFDRVSTQLRRWTKANGLEVRALARRRQREIDLFFEGLPKPRAAAPAGENTSPIDIRAGESHSTEQSEVPQQ